MTNSLIEPYGKIRRDIANTLGFKAIGILSIITANINLRTNEFRCSLASLAKLLETSVPTLNKYTKILEDAGYIKVTRKGGGSHHEVNVYHLAGKHAETALLHVKSIDATSKETLHHGLNNFTPGVKKLYTDYIDNKDIIGDEEDNLNFLSQSDSVSGEYLLEADGQDKSLNEQDSALTQIERIGITGTALEAAKLHPERIAPALALASSVENIRDKNAYIARVLINGTYESNNTDVIQEKFSDTQSQESPYEGMTWKQMLEAQHDHKPPVQQPPAPKNADLTPSTDHSQTITTDSNWTATYNQLELQLDANSFDSYLKYSKFIGIEDGKYIIATHTEYAQKMLQHRLYRNVKRVLSDVLGKPTELRFIVQSEATT